MSLSFADGQLVITDETVDPPEIVFDSSEKLLNCLGAPITGSKTINARTAWFNPTNGTSSKVNVNTNHVLASINAAATHVFGSFHVSYGGAQVGVTGLGYFSAGGTYVHEQGAPRTPNMGPTNWHPQNYAGYTFLASGGQLLLNERVYLDAGTIYGSETLYLILDQITFQYKLFVGTLT